MKNYFGITILIAVALLAGFTPLLRTDLALDFHIRDQYYVIPIAKVIFRICLATATVWILLVVARGTWARLR